jgi:Carboxypeptidase regulatory-like domain
MELLLRAMAAFLVLGVCLGIWTWWQHRVRANTPALSVVTAHPDPGGVEGLAEPKRQTGSGDQHLYGYVLDGAGAPVAGVQVWAQREPSIYPPAQPLDPPAQPLAAPLKLPSGTAATAPSAKPSGGAAAAGATASSSQEVPAGALSAATAADGRFELLGAEPGPYRVRVSGRGIFSAELAAVPIPGPDVSVVVARKVSIAGRVTERNQPVTGATVDISGDAIGGTVELVSGPGGAFALPVLPEGAYDVVAYRDDLASPTLHLERFGAGPFAEVELGLDTAAVVVGRVFEQRAEPGNERGAGVVAALELRPLGDDEPARYAQSGADGRFRIDGVHRGRWVVSALAPGYVLPDPVEIDAGVGLVEIGVVAGGAIEGVVRDSGGTPIAGASLRAVVPASKQELSGDREASLLARFGGRTEAVVPVWDAASAARQDPRFVARGELGVLLGPLPPIPPLGARSAVRGIMDRAELPPELASLSRPPSFAVAPSQASRWTTDAEGRYRLRGIAPGRYTVVARAPGFAEGRHPGVVVPSGTSIRDVDLSLSVGTFVVGEIRDDRGEPVIGARLVASGDAMSPLETRSNGDGSYRLGPCLGMVQLEASAPGHASAQRRVDLGVVAGSIAAEHREALRIAVYDAVVRGVVEDVRGAPLAGARISIVQGPAAGRGATTSADGSFTIDQLPPGATQLRIEHPEVPTSQVAAEPGGLARLRVELGGGLEGRLVDEAGLAMAGVRIRATGPGSSSAEAATGRDGSFLLHGLAPGTWQLAASRAGYLPIARAVNVGAATRRGEVTVRDVTLALARGATAGGTVRDARGNRVAGVRVWARNAEGGTAETRSDLHGEFRIRDCPTGDVEIAAERDGARVSTRVMLRPGQEVVSLMLELSP